LLIEKRVREKVKRDGLYLVDSFNLSCKKGGERIKVVVEKGRIC